MKGEDIFFCYILGLFEFLEASDHTIVQEFRIILVKLLSVSLVLKSVSKKRLQHWHSHRDFSMNIWENYYLILQIPHGKTFKLRYSNSK
jgi:hypothetical protein